ncbi:unnamed protein product [Rhizopus stolonifer]
MPPKKQPQSKAEKAKKQKAAEDKTFGMKNKNKSTKVQKYIQQVQAQGKSVAPNTKKEDKKELEKKKREEFSELLIRYKHHKKYLLEPIPKRFFACISRLDTVKREQSVNFLTMSMWDVRLKRRTCIQITGLKVKESIFLLFFVTINHGIR